MTISGTFSTSLSGLNAATAKLNRAAADIANMSASAAGTTNGPGLEHDVVDMMVAKFMYKANAAVIRTTDEMTGAMLNMRA